MLEGTPRSGEEAVYAGFGLEQTQRGARRVGPTNNAHQIIPRTNFKYLHDPQQSG